MSLREILVYPDSRLTKKSASVKSFDSVLHKLLDDMAETMYTAQGVGLAGPQVGENIRAVVVDVDFGEDGRKNTQEFINPEIIKSEGSQMSEEGCLSLPGFKSTVKRKESIVVEAFNRNGNTVVVEASDFLSRVLQHEIDHLDGIMFFDRMSGLKKQLFKRKIKKALVLK